MTKEKKAELSAKKVQPYVEYNRFALIILAVVLELMVISLASGKL